MVLQKWHWLLGIPQPMTAEDLLLERNRRLDRYNNRPPIKKLAQDSPENNYNICGLTNKDVWKVNITTKKTGEYTFFTNFQHKVFLESLPSYRQSANIPSKLPKIPYLRPSQPLATSTTNNPYQQNNDTNKHKSSTSDSVKLVNLKFENAKPSNRPTKSNTQLKIQRPDHIQIQPHQTLYQIQDQITGCERRLRSRSSSSKEEKGLKLKKGKEVVVVFKGCDSANCSSLDDINKLEFEQELMGNLQQKSSEGSYRPRGKYTTTSSDERFFKKPVVEKKKYFEKSANLQGTKMIADCNHILKRVITDTVEQHVQSDNYCSYDERLYSTTCRAIVERPSKSKTIPEGMKRSSELFNPNYNFDKRKSGKKSEKSGSIIESIREKVMQYKEVNDSDSDLSYEWHKNSAHTRFPKETRTAVAVMMANQRSSGTHRCNLKNSETQTSPAVSVARAGGPVYRVPKSYRKIPCPKNLLCERGLHVGRCGRVVNKGNHLYFKREVRTIESLSTVNSMQNELVLATVSQEPFQKIMEPTSEKKDMVVELASGDNDYLSSPSPVESSTDSTIQTITPTMNGMNGHTNGELNGCGDIITQNQQKGCWTIGLINSKYRYLTAETFGFKINANGTSLKKKQIWTLEPDMSNSGDSLIYLRSHLQKYLAVDSFGNVTCESDEKDPGCKFQISVAEDGSGRWALRNVVRGYFLGSSSDKLTCTAKVPSDAELWHVHLAARPQVNLRSVGRKRFAHLSENLDEIHVDANVPWGEDTLFTLEFRLEESGKYAIHTCNNKYLSLGGKLVDNCTKDCLFSAEYHSGQLALRDRNGAYLSPIGSKAVLKTRSQTVTKDELFSLEDSLPQASFVAALNNKFVSVKQGVDVTANQDEISDHETFQLEFDWNTKRWYIRTMQDRYWTLETGGGIQAAGDKRSSNALFDLVWQDDGSVAFRANNGRYVITKRSGHLYATSDTVDENCKYFFYLVNRPILVLKCEQGFVGHKSANNTKLECNKATYETIQVERAEKGVVYFKGTNGKYWHVDSEGVTADTDTPEGFYLELREPTRLCIKSVSGNYLTASKNGCFRLGDSSVESATQWEY